MIIVDNDKCIGCGICQKQCPFQAIVMVEKLPQIDEKCTLCGACVNVCPAKALSLELAQKKVQGDWSGILVFCEQYLGRISPVVYELLGKGRQLADQLGQELSCIVIGDEIEDVQSLFGHGADDVHIISHPKLCAYNSEYYANILADFIREKTPNIFLIGASNLGRELAPRISTRLRAGLTADCTVLEANEEGLLVQTRPAFGGNIMASIVSPHARPQMATVRYKVLEKPKNTGKKGKIIRSKPDQKHLKGPIEVLEELPLPSDEDIVNSECIVAGGKGMGKKEGFLMLNDLASLIGGSVAASRPAIDALWAQYPVQIGLSGKVVKPRLYIGCGISGAVQHTVGMESANTIVAVNKDPKAPIFDIADFGIVADVNELLPELIKELKSRGIREKESG